MNADKAFCAIRVYLRSSAAICFCLAPGSTLASQAKRRAKQRGGHGTAFHLGPGVNRLMKFVSKRPAWKSGSARMRCCMGMEV